MGCGLQAAIPPARYMTKRPDACKASGRFCFFLAITCLDSEDFRTDYKEIPKTR